MSAHGRQERDAPPRQHCLTAQTMRRRLDAISAYPLGGEALKTHLCDAWVGRPMQQPQTSRVVHDIERMPSQVMWEHIVGQTFRPLQQ